MADEKIVVLTIRGRTEGVNEAKAAISALGVTYEQVDQTINRHETSLERLARSNNTLYAATQRQIDREQQIERAYRASIETGGDATRALELRNIALTGLSQRTEAAMQRINGQSAADKLAAAAAKDAAAAQERLALTAQRYKDSLDPLLPLQRAYRAELAQIKAAADAGLISEQQRIAVLTRTKAAFAEQVTTLRGVAPAAETAAGSTRKFGMMAQAAGYQVGDLATQISMGGNAMTAIAVQGAQFLGVFGVGGAVAGAVLTVAGLTYNVLSAGDATKTAKDRANDYETALKALKSAADATAGAIKGVADETANLARTQGLQAIEAERQYIGAERKRLDALREEFVVRQMAAEGGPSIGGSRGDATAARALAQASDAVGGVEASIANAEQRILRTEAALKRLANAGPEMVAKFEAEQERALRLAGMPADRRAIASAQDEAERKVREGLAGASMSGGDIEAAVRTARNRAAEIVRRQQAAADAERSNTRSGTRGERLAERTETSLDALDARATGAERLAAAMRAGSEAVREAEIRNGAFTVAIKAGAEGSAAFEAAYSRATGALERESVAKAEQNLAKWTAGTTDSIEATRRLIDATRLGADAVRDTTAANEALNVARTAGAPLDAKTLADLEEQIRLRNELNVSLASEARLKALEADVDRAREERALVGVGRREVALQRARSQQRAILRTEGVSPLDPTYNARIDAAAKIAELDMNAEAATASLDYLGQMGERSFDRIGASVTEMSLKGENALESLGNVGRAIFSELAQEALKLGAINPLKNALFGQSNPTMSSVFGALGGLAGGGSFIPAGSPGLGMGTGGLPAIYGRGGVFQHGAEVVPFADGGIVTGPTTFPMAGGRTGLMGEAGAEAIMPLTRGPGGHLGVRALSAPQRAAASPVVVNSPITINAPGADQAGLQQVVAAVRELNQSIESRAIRAVQDGRALDPRLFEKGGG